MLDKKLYDAVMKVYLSSLMVHFVSKKEDYPLHKFSEQVYEESFEFVHKIAERLSDLNKPIDSSWLETLKTDLYESLGDLLKVVNESIGEDKPTLGTDNLLRGLADTAEDLFGSARAFVKKSEQETDKDLENFELMSTLFKE